VIFILEIEKQIGKNFVDGELSSPEEICKKQLYKVMNDIIKTDMNINTIMQKRMIG
jgi:ATP-dependent RNA helicase DeaD